MKKLERMTSGLRLGRLFAISAVALAGGVFSAHGQDTRTVTEPVIPTGCTVLAAQQAIAGGEPASETTFDTSRLQTALNATGASCVELTTGGSNSAFLIGPITLPANMTLVVDGGVTVFGSRNPADYQVSTAGVETCGTVGTSGNGCNALITVPSGSSNAGIMGYGIIDGRGQDKLLVNGTAASYSWWDQAGTAQNVSGSQNNPILVQANGANFTLYKITVRNSPMFHVKWSGNTTTRTGFTAWGVKVITPFTARNSDGIDPSGGNITVTNSSISDGDDMVAISAASTAQNITIQNLNTYSGHGISVGSYSQGNLSNMLVQNITQMGTAADGNGGGLRIKTAQDRGGLVQNVTYQNICSANVKSPIYLSPYYNTNAGTSYPTFSNIVYRNIHVVTEGTITLTGYANTGATVVHPATVTFDNLIIDTIKQTDFSPNPPAYLNVTEGPGPVTSLLLNQTGTGDTYSGGITNPTQAPYPCTPSTFQYLVGELFGTAAGATNLHSAAITTNGTVTLNAMLQPAMSQVTYASISGQGSYTGTAAPTAQVQFKEGTNVVGTASLGGNGTNGTLASVTLSGLTAGMHTYTAFYAGDSTYTVPYAFGSVTVTVAPASPTTTTVTATPASVTYGTGTALSAAVTSAAAGTPTGQVVFVDNATTQLASAALASASAQSTQVLGVGSHSLTAVYGGDTNFASSTSAAVPVTVTMATPAVTLAPGASSLAYGSSTTLTATVAPSGSGSYPTGSVIFNDGTAIVGSSAVSGAGVASASVTPGGGSHSYTASYSGDSNYAKATSSTSVVAVSTVATTTTLTVTGGTAYGNPNTLTATVASGVSGTPAGPSGTVTFYSGTTVVGSGTLSGSSTVTVTALLMQGVNSLTAKYAGDNNYTGSTSTATALTLSAPITLAATPSSLTLAPGGNGSASISITPAGGFTGTVTLTCASPVSFITCAVTPASATITSASAVTATLTVQVAPTVAKNEAPGLWQGTSRTWLALLMPFAGLALARKRRLLRGALFSLGMLTVFAVFSGCAGSPSSSTSKLPPAGTQTITVTATGGIASSSTSVSVNVTN